jgi:hypothetical protein
MATSPRNFKPNVDNVKSEFTKQLQLQIADTTWPTLTVPIHQDLITQDQNLRYIAVNNSISVGRVDCTNTVSEKVRKGVAETDVAITKFYCICKTTNHYHYSLQWWVSSANWTPNLCLNKRDYMMMYYRAYVITFCILMTNYATVILLQDRLDN